MADLITISRMFLSILLLFLPFPSLPFLALYIAGGVTDMADGFVARATGTAGARGAKLDSLADGVFFLSSAIKIIPSLCLPPLLWAPVMIVLLVRVANLLHSFLKGREPLHTTADKITGFLLFLLPLSLGLVPIMLSASVVIAVALFAAIEETVLLWRGKGEK